MAEQNHNQQQQNDSAPADKLAVSSHTVTINGEQIAYTVTAGTIVLKEEREKEGDAAGTWEGEQPRAEIFFVAYTRDDVADASRRPITFSFNGGPGSSSVWLHLGVLGPRRVELDDDGNMPPPPYRLIPNESSLLDVSDLVFIDPVSTGYSRVVPGQKAKDFHSFQKDIESVGDFVRLYTSRYRRWESPKFLAGESYGTTRAGGLAGYLQDRHGMFLNGLMLISSVLDFQTVHFEIGNDLPYILFLPTFAATAWYHKRLSEDLQRDLRSTLAEVEAFALGEYATALLKGAAIPEEERRRIVDQLARYTGLRPEYIEAANLRIEIHRFVKELLRDSRRTVGRLDSRFTGIERDAAGEHHQYDPSYSNIQGPYTATLNHYLRADLGFESDLPYEILTGRVQPWSFSDHENRYVNVAETLRHAMTINPFLKVYVASGFYDLATPYFATQHTVSHLELDPSLRGNITQGFFEAGHMMYIHRPSLGRLKADLAAFVRDVTGGDR
jgi:carboxypeptidase C (cathepsin A)